MNFYRVSTVSHIAAYYMYFFVKKQSSDEICLFLFFLKKYIKLLVT